MSTRTSRTSASRTTSSRSRSRASTTRSRRATSRRRRGTREHVDAVHARAARRDEGRLVEVDEPARASGTCRRLTPARSGLLAPCPSPRLGHRDPLHRASGGSSNQMYAQVGGLGSPEARPRELLEEPAPAAGSWVVLSAIQSASASKRREIDVARRASTSAPRTDEDEEAVAEARRGRRSRLAAASAGEQEREREREQRRTSRAPSEVVRA